MQLLNFRLVFAFSVQPFVLNLLKLFKCCDQLVFFCFFKRTKTLKITQHHILALNLLSINPKLIYEPLIHDIIWLGRGGCANWEFHSAFNVDFWLLLVCISSHCGWSSEAQSSEIIIIGVLLHVHECVCMCVCVSVCKCVHVCVRACVHGSVRHRSQSVSTHFCTWTHKPWLKCRVLAGIEGI